MRATGAICAGAWAGVALAGLAGWGLFVEPRRLTIERLEVALPRLPATWQGRRVGLIADLQVGMYWANVGTIRRAVQRLVHERPEIVLLGGDFLYKPADELDAQVGLVVDLLTPLTRAGLSTYAVLGNHDFAAHALERGQRTQQWADALAQGLRSIGIRVLENESIALDPPSSGSTATNANGQLYLVGLGPHVPAKDDPLSALQSLPDGAARIVLLHNPATFLALPADAAPLAVAGHTHGGQSRLPWHNTLTRWAIGQRAVEAFGAGWIQDYGEPGNRLYINRGIGFSVLPARLNCPPEVTLITLRAGPDRAVDAPLSEMSTRLDAAASRQ